MTDHLNVFSVEEQFLLEALAKQENEKAQAIITLTSWGAAASLASDDDKMGIAEALRELEIYDLGSCLSVSDLYELDREDLEPWINQYWEFKVDWDDADDIRMAWESTCVDANNDELAKFARAAFERFRAEFLREVTE
jgi:hypothetical protein